MKSLAVVCVRALGAYLIILNVGTFSVVGVSQLMLASSSGALRSVGWSLVLTPVVFMGVGALVIAFSKSLAGILTRGLQAPEAPAAGPRDLLNLGTALIGLFFVASAAPSLFEAVWVYLGPDLSAGDRFRDVAERLQRSASILTRAAGQAVAGGVLLWMARPLFARKAA